MSDWDGGWDEALRVRGKNGMIVPGVGTSREQGMCEREGEKDNTVAEE